MTSIQELLKQKRQSIADKRMGSKKTYRFKGGVTTVRILPGWRKSDPTFYHEFGQTFIKNMDGDVLAVVGDRMITYGEDDVVRNLLQRAKGDARTDAQREHYHDMLAKSRVLVNALILDDKEIDPTIPQIVEFSESQFDNILQQVELAGIDEEFLDLDSGFNLKVSKTGRGKNDTKYSFAFDRKASSVDKSVMESVVDLDSYVRSQFEGTDRAVNALKSITQGVHVPKALGYAGDADTVDAEFDPVEEAKTVHDETIVESRRASSEDIEKLFGNE